MRQLIRILWYMCLRFKNGEPRKRQLILRLAMVSAIPISGLMVFIGGVFYALETGCFPYPDAPPEWYVNQQYHMAIGEKISDVGAFIFLIGLLSLVVLTPVIMWSKPHPAIS